jgi:two-component system cell cycle response regulator DivK
VGSNPAIPTILSGRHERRPFLFPAGRPARAPAPSGSSQSSFLTLHVTLIANLSCVAKRTILVVEDTAEIREVWQRVLTAAGYDVLQAHDGADGVHQAREHQPDLILMDVTLPVLDGISAVQKLKADGSTAHVPVIFVSGDVFASRRARAVGGSEFLAKPVRAADLLSAIARTLADADRPSRRRLPDPAAHKRR